MPTKAIILAAGKSTRTFPLTITTPKPLLKIANKTILEHNLDNLQGVVKEAIIIVGYKKEQIISHFKSKRYKKINLTFIEQKKQLGTGNAVLIAKDNCKEDILVLNGDDIYCTSDFRNVAKKKYSVLSTKVKDPSKFGVFITKKDKIIDVIEKPQDMTTANINCGLYHFSSEIFKILKELKISQRGEYELTDGLKEFVKTHDVYTVMAESWNPIGYPWDLLTADKALRKKSIIGKGTKVTGTVINSSIGENCIIEGKVKNSILFDNIQIKKGSVVENSVIASNVTFSGDIYSKHKTYSKVNKVAIEVSNFGAVIANDVVAQVVHIESGVKIWPKKKVSGTITHDIE